MSTPLNFYTSINISSYNMRNNLVKGKCIFVVALCRRVLKCSFLLCSWLVGSPKLGVTQRHRTQISASFNVCRQWGSREVSPRHTGCALRHTHGQSWFRSVRYFGVRVSTSHNNFGQQWLEISTLRACPGHVHKGELQCHIGIQVSWSCAFLGDNFPFWHLNHRNTSIY